jgi:hypothetical protein
MSEHLGVSELKMNLRSACRFEVVIINTNMRQYIDLIESSLNEAPLANYEFHGSQDMAGTFEKSDLKTIQHPTWEARLLHTFANVPEPVNVYVMNYPDDKYVKSRTPNGRHVDLKPLKGQQDDYRGYQDWSEIISGFYQPEDFEKNFGFLPPKYQESITVVLTHNYGDGKIPLTPWMIVHRLMHALNHQTNSEWTRLDRGDSQQYMNKAVQAFRNAFSYLLPEELGGLNRASDVEKFARSVSNLKSARNGIERSGEFILELCAQYFIKGDFYFNTKNSPKFDGIKPDIEEANHYLEKARGYLADWRTNLKGVIVVL